eukprot:7926466-Pyramimonas_sp.AAC.2
MHRKPPGILRPVGSEIRTRYRRAGVQARNAISGVQSGSSGAQSVNSGMQSGSLGGGQTHRKI